MSSSPAAEGLVAAAEAELEDAFMRSMVRRMVSWKLSSVGFGVASAGLLLGGGGGTRTLGFVVVDGFGCWGVGGGGAPNCAIISSNCRAISGLVWSSLSMSAMPDWISLAKSSSAAVGEASGRACDGDAAAGRPGPEEAGAGVADVVVESIFVDENSSSISVFLLQHFGSSRIFGGVGRERDTI